MPRGIDFGPVDARPRLGGGVTDVVVAPPT